MKYVITEKLREHFDGYERHDQIYNLGGLLLFVLFIFFVLLSTFVSRELLTPFVIFSGLLIASLFTFAVLLEFRKPVRYLIEKVWFKWCVGAISILVFKFSQVQSDWFINNLTGLDPSLLNFSSSVLTAVYLPYSWLVVISLILSLYLLLHWFFIPFERNYVKRKPDSGKYLARVIGVGVIFYLAVNLIDFFEDPDSFASIVAKSLILKTEYFSKSYCKNISSTELVADIGNGNISVFNMKENTFQIKKCDINYSD